MKMPEMERKLNEQMSEIEKNIVAKADAKLAEKIEEEKTPDYNWWHYNDDKTYFCVSTQSQYTFKPGQQIFTSYGRRSNKFLMTFYGFCITDNRHDSVVMRIRRKLDATNRLTMDGIVEQLVMSPADIEAGSRRQIELEREQALHPDTFEWPADEDDFYTITSGIQLKHKKLSVELLAYLRAHCLLFYDGDDICSVRVTVPTDVDYEIIVIKAYRAMLDKFKELNPQRFSPMDEEEIIPDCDNPGRRQMIINYRLSQCQIMSAQYSLVNTVLMILQQVKVIKLSHTYAITQLCCNSTENLMNCLHMRKYLKQLFAPNEPIMSDSEDSDDEDEDGPEAVEIRSDDIK